MLRQPAHGGDDCVLDDIEEFLKNGGIEIQSAFTDNFTEIPEKIQFAIDLLAGMAISRLAEILGKTDTEMCYAFMGSKTAEALYDESCKIWWFGPDAVADLYLEETNQSER